MPEGWADCTGMWKKTLGWDLSDDTGARAERFFREKSHLGQDDPTAKGGNTDSILLLFKENIPVPFL